jgi:hypothetical protein
MDAFELAQLIFGRKECFNFNKVFSGGTMTENIRHLMANCRRGK